MYSHSPFLKTKIKRCNRSPADYSTIDSYLSWRPCDTGGSTSNLDQFKVIKSNHALKTNAMVQGNHNDKLMHLSSAVFLYHIWTIWTKRSTNAPCQLNECIWYGWRSRNANLSNWAPRVPQHYLLMRVPSMQYGAFTAHSICSSNLLLNCSACIFKMWMCVAYCKYFVADISANRVENMWVDLTQAAAILGGLVSTR